MNFIRRGLFYVIYIWMVVGAGMWYLYQHFGSLDIYIWREMAVLIFLGVLAEWLVVTFPHGQLTGGFAVVLATYLVYGPSAAVWVTGLFTFIGQGATNYTSPLRSILFNTSQSVLALAAAFYIYEKAGGTMPGGGFSLVNILPVLAFTAAYFLTNHVLVYIYLLPQRRYSGRVNWTDALKWDGITYLFTMPFGVAMAMLYDEYQILGASLLFLPVLVIQFVMRLYVNLELANRELVALYEVARRLGTMWDADEILELVLKEARRVVSYHTGVVYLWSEEQRVYLPRVVRSPYARHLHNTVLESGHGVIGWSIHKQKPDIVYDTRIDPRAKNEQKHLQFLRSLLVIPLVVDAEVLGVLVLGDRRPMTFEEKHLQILTIIGGQAAVAVAKSYLHGRVEALASTDEVSQLYNQRYFYLRLQAEYDRAVQNKTSFALVVIDFDGFKKINERYGHLSGDVIIAEAARLIRSNVRPGDIVARYGGGEFAILLPEIGQEEVRQLAAKLQRVIKRHGFKVDGVAGGVYLTASLGVVMFPEDADNLIDMLKLADKALHRAKESGGDRVEFNIEKDRDKT